MATLHPALCGSNQKWATSKDFSHVAHFWLEPQSTGCKKAINQKKKLTAWFQLKNWSAPAWLVLAWKLFSSAWLSLGNFSSNSSLNYPSFFFCSLVTVATLHPALCGSNQKWATWEKSLDVVQRIPWCLLHKLRTHGVWTSIVSSHGISISSSFFMYI